MKLRMAIVVCIAAAVAQVGGGAIFNSTALYSEAVHMGSDAFGYIISLTAMHIGGREATETHTYGFDRIETIGALTNVLLIWALCVPLVVSAVSRLAHPDDHEAPDGRMVLAFGTFGLVLNSTLAAAFWGDSGHSHGNMSERAAKLHIAGDVLESISVMAAGALMWWQPSWRAADPLCVFLFTSLIFCTTVILLRDVYYILMEASPRNAARTEEILKDFHKIEGVCCVTCVHVWEVSPGKTCLTAKLHVLPSGDLEDVQRDALSYTRYKYGIFHSTLQVAKDQDLLW